MYYHFTPEILTKEDLKDVKRQRIDFKPKGLWLSYDEEWLEFSLDMPHPEQISSWNTYEVEIDQKNLLQVDSYEKAKEVAENYSRGESNGIKLINWNMVARDYDGIVVSNYQEIMEKFNKELYKTKSVKYAWIQTFDINCACIWKPSKVVKKWKYINVR